MESQIKNIKKVNSKKIMKETNINQINLKISQNLLSQLDQYSDEFGYTNNQELIREAIRDKLHGSNTVRKEYLDKLFHDDEFNTPLSQEESINLMETKRKEAKINE
jgi:hypothetical protein